MIEVRTREQVVAGIKYKVPTNVSRVDCEKAHGWQVRFKADTSKNKFFSDSMHGGTQLAFVAAKRYANRWRPAPKLQCKVGKDVGIREVQRNQGGLVHYFVEVSAIVNGGVPRRFYIGTENTWSAKRRNAALSLARRYRKALMATRATQIKEQRWKSEARL